MIQPAVVAAPLTLAEWSTETVEYGEPSAADERLAARLRDGEGLAEVEWLHDGSMRIQSKAWIGVLNFTRLQVRIVPKLVGSELGVLRMVEYCSSLQSLRLLDVDRLVASQGSNLLDLICELLNEECDALVREGLLQDYVAREDSLPALRGRLRLRDQVMRRFGQVDVLECSFDEFESDILENQILGAGLSAAHQVATATEVRQRSARLGGLFADVCDSSRLDPVLARASLVYHRRNEHYRAAHEWAFMLLEASAIREMFDVGDRRVSVFLINMNRLFERFVTTLLTDAYVGSDIRVSSQRRTPSVIVDEASGRTYARIIPDILLDAPAWNRKRLPIDAKYKLYDSKDVAPGDIYQTFMYAIAFADPTGPTPTSVIIYPGVGTGRSTDLAILRETKTRSARIFCISLDVPELLDAVGDRGHSSGTQRQALARIREICDGCLGAA